MRNKLSFDLQLSARKAAIAERIAAHKIARSKSVGLFNGDVRWRVYGDRIYFLPFRYRRCPVFTGITHLVGGLALHSALFCWRFAAPACSPRR
ncbi:formate transporter FocB [Escherichia coli]|nr:formate transporter FocB [Escherichia coli]